MTVHDILQAWLFATFIFDLEIQAIAATIVHH